MLTAGKKISQRGNKLTIKSSQEAKYLYLIYQALVALKARMGS